MRQHGVDGLIAAVLWLVNSPLTVPYDLVFAYAPLHLGAAIPLIWRRDRPLTVLVVSAAFDLTAITLTGQSSIAMVTACAIYTVGRYLPGRRAWLAAGAVFGAYVGTLIILAIFATRIPGEPVAAGLWIALMVVIGQLVRLRTELTARRRQTVIESAIRSERQRIARELHDVVAHHVTTMNVLVGAARTSMVRDPRAATETLATAEQSGREAMTEMRQLFFLLRGESDASNEADEIAYGVNRLPELINRTAATGPPATFRVAGEPVVLPTTVDRAIYRLVQESLTNAHKHATGAPTTVDLRYQVTTVEVEVLTGRSAQPAEKSTSGGFGLTGMAERVAFCAGELRTGPTDDGGFRVYARIPVTP